MKKFWMISMLLIAALFVISCGEAEDDGGEGGAAGVACDNQGAFRCTNGGATVQKCDQQEWKNFMECNEEQVCNATTGKCDPKDNGGNTEPTDPTSTEPTDPTSTEPTDPTSTEPTEPTDDALNCGEIYQCMYECGQDQNCQQACYDKGSANGQTQIMALLQCLNTCSESSTTDDEFQDCANSQCSAEIAGCEGLGGSGDPADNRYNAPYGSLSLNFSIDQIANDTDGQDSQVGIATSAFATGTYGNGSASVTPADAYMIQSMASYSVDSQGNSIGIQQVPFYHARHLQKRQLHKGNTPHISSVHPVRQQ